MAYSKQTWDTTSYVNPTRMNHIEQGIYDASTATGTEYSSGVSVKQKIDNFTEITGYTVATGIDSSKIKVYEHLGFIYIEFDNANITSNVLAYSSIITGLPRSKGYALSALNDFNSNGNVSTIIGAYLNHEDTTLRQTSALSSGHILAGSVIYPKL